MNLNHVKREVERMDGVERAAIERQRTGGLVLEVRAERDLLEELDGLKREGTISELKPVGKFMGAYEYELR